MNNKGVNNPNYKHGDNGTHLHNVWIAMKRRCSDKNQNDYRHYGGRGIKVCNEWMDYLTFKKWATNNGYKENLEIDRINVDGNYEPSNCRWVTRKENTRNCRSNHFITINNITKTVSEWSEITGIDRKTITEREKRGYKNNEILSKQRLKSLFININEESKTLSEWAEISGLDRRTIRKRLDLGWSGEKLLKPVRRNKNECL